MKRIAFSLISAALLSVAVVPMAQAAPNLNHKGGLHPAILNSAHTTPTDTEPSAQAHPTPALEQARLNRLDQVANNAGSLSQQQATVANDLDPHNLASVSPLMQMRLNHLNNSN